MTCLCGMSKLLEWYERGQSCLRPENPWSQRQVKWEPWSQCQKKSEPDRSIWLCELCAPMVCHLYHTWKTSNFEIENGWFPNYGKVRLFPGKLRPPKSVGFWQKWNLVIPYLIIPVIRWSLVLWSGTDHAINKRVIRRRRSSWWEW